MDLVFAIIWSMSLLVGVVALIVVITEKTPEEDTKETIYLTEEEMEARPIMVSSINIVGEPEVHDTETEAAELEEEVEEDPYHPYDFIPMDDELQVHCQMLCDTYDVGFAFFLAMVESESAFSLECYGDSGNSIGPCQINRPNWYRYDLNAHVPADNVEIGIRMLSELIIKYQDTDKVIMGYKGGEDAMLKWVKEGTRLSACDEVANATIWWQERLDEWENK